MAKKTGYYEDDLHSEDLQEIIAKPPSWLLQRGITFILLTVLMMIGLSFYIKYPEMVAANLKFNTVQAPKVVVSKTQANISRLLVADESWVKANTGLAYMESTADHGQVLMVLDTLKQYRERLIELDNLEEMLSPSKLNLGELQSSYHNFYLAYLNYQAASKQGIFDRRRKLLVEEMSNIREQKSHIQETYDLQKRELALAEAEFEKYKILAEKEIISPIELQQKEATLLIKRQSIPQMENTIINNQGSMLSKDKELSEIDNQIMEERKKFVQALNSFISEGENWKKQYVLTAPVSGKLIYSSFLQENQLIKMGEELFYINPNNEEYYGEMFIPQASSSKVKRNQEVLIKVRSYPYEEYGYLRGKIAYISDIPVRDSVFFSRVDVLRHEKDSLIKLKPGILADAEIITEDQSVFKRIWLNLTKSLKF
ncbi:HlyD family secretion protein [Sphingobacterium deserti]|uniref:HlyD family efflux transporter periplasmic adaptor subunit n=1 Tax=Sphingobacterium deserti TaxID=1229276 RepID=A0A0B8T720_9SPHI|nr:HlyD family efflux transporter periplasmic adaptor subunit [Sphingobacterium deserti]KGE13340.1 hypothetical protein DI53_2871 [Sphingobacterium deserti]